MVIDSSALIAILRDEPDGAAMLRAMRAAPTRLISAVTVLEASMVIEGGWGRDQGKDLDLLLHTFQVETVAFDATQGELARSAWQEFGKGRHPAALNLGDCCVYALAELRGEPILAKGNDFARTPIQVVALDRP